MTNLGNSVDLEHNDCHIAMQIKLIHLIPFHILSSLDNNDGFRAVRLLFLMECIENELIASNVCFFLTFTQH